MMGRDKAEREMLIGFLGTVSEFLTTKGLMSSELRSAFAYPAWSHVPLVASSWLQRRHPNDMRSRWNDAGSSRRRASMVRPTVTLDDARLGVPMLRQSPVAGDQAIGVDLLYGLISHDGSPLSREWKGVCVRRPA